MFADRASRAALDQLDPETARRLEAAVAGYAYYYNRSQAMTLGGLRSSALGRYRGPVRARLAEAVPAVVDALLADGHLSVSQPFMEADPFGASFQQPTVRYVGSRREGASPAEAAAAYRKGWAARVGRGLEAWQVAKLEELFFRARQASRAVDTESGRLTVLGKAVRFAVAVPRHVTLGREGALPDGALVFAVTAFGAAHAYDVPSERLAVTYPEDDVSASCDLTGLRRSASVEAKSELVPYARLSVPYACQYAFDWEALEEWAGFPLGVRLRNAVSKALSRKRRRNDKLASAQFRRHLDPDVVRSAGRLAQRRVTMAAYSFFAPPEPRKAAWRRQAAEAYPLLATAFSASRHADLRRAIDKGQQLAPLLQERLGIKQAVLRRVGRLHWQRTGRGVAQGVAEANRVLAAMLNACPPERLPVGKKQWRGLQNLLDFIEAAEADRYPFDDGQIAAAVAAVSRRWEGFDESWRRVCDMAADVGGHVRRALGASGSRHAWRVHLRLVGGAAPPLVALAEKSALWHADLERLHRRVAEIGARDARSAAAWEPLDEPFSAPGGGGIAWLTCRPELEAESARMHHCVRTYVGACLFGDSHIGAVTGARGGRSTVEFRPARTKGKWGLVTVQHHTLHDAPPPDDCKAVVAAFLEARAAAIDYPRLEAGLKERLARRHSYDEMNAWAFSAADPAQCRAVVELYRPYLAPEWRKAGFDELAAGFGAAPPEAAEIRAAAAA